MTPVGPLPTPDPSVWADPTRRRVLAALAGHEQPVALAVLAAEVGGHPNTTRRHLEALRVAGIVERTTDPAPARGRPGLLHALTPVGRSVVRRIEVGEDAPQFDDEGLTQAFVRYVAGIPDPGGLARQVGQGWGESVGKASRARTREGRRRAVRDVFDRMGFTPVEIEPSDQDAAGEVDEIVMRTCPLLTSASEHPEVVCSVHEGLVEGMLAQTGAQARVELVPWGRPEGCLLTIDWSDRA